MFFFYFQSLLETPDKSDRGFKQTPNKFTTPSRALDLTSSTPMEKSRSPEVKVTTPDVKVITPDDKEVLKQCLEAFLETHISI